MGRRILSLVIFPMGRTTARFVPGVFFVSDVCGVRRQIRPIAPRFVAIGGAQEDTWADPYSEQLNCVASTPAWEINGKKGFVGPETFAKVGDDFSEGSISFHYRDGVHFLGRGDWLSYMAFVKKNL